MLVLAIGLFGPLMSHDLSGVRRTSLRTSPHVNVFLADHCPGRHERGMFIEEVEPGVRILPRVRHHRVEPGLAHWALNLMIVINGTNATTQGPAGRDRGELG